MGNKTEYGSFVPTTYNNAQNKETRLALNQIALSCNSKTSGLYDTDEFVTGNLFFPNPTLASTTERGVLRPTYRKVINFGALPNATTKTVAHGLDIQSSWTVTRLYGAATSTGGSFIPIPYAHPTPANTVTLSADSTDIRINTGINRSTYTNTYVVLEYIKT